jgi:hypothetical protein
LITVGLCLVFSTIGAFWLKWATFPNVAAALCEAVPPIPAIATLVFLVLLGAVLKRIAPRLKLAAVQIITVYAFVSVSVSIGFLNLYRRALAWTNTPLYIGEQNTSIARITEYMPSWLAPGNEVVIEQFWQGRAEVPWEHWLVPMLCLGGMFLAFYVITICLLRIFYKRWSQEERLIYPVAEFALSLVEDKGGRRERGTIFASGVFWWGCAIALVFNIFYIIPSLHPTMPLPPTYIDASRYFTGHPWNKIGMWQIRLNPIIFGLGYLVSLDVLLSIWVSFLFIKLQTVFLAARGTSGGDLFGLGGQMGIGAYLAITFTIFYAARRYVWKALKTLLPGRGRPEDPMEAGRWTVVMLIAGVVGLTYAMVSAGIVFWVALVFLAMIVIRGLVMARVRAQGGMPLIYFHVGGMRDLVWLLGGTTLAAAGMRTTAGLVFLGFLASLTYLAPHHADAFKLAERSKLGTRRWVPLAILAVVVGLILVNVTHLPAFYDYGATNIASVGSPRAWDKVPAITATLRASSPNWFKISMAGEGAILTGVLTYMRRFYWFPLHPLGYVIACAIGYRVFAPIFAVWFIKWSVLKYFGGRIHKKTRKLMIGIVLGHFTIAAILAVLAVFGWPPTERYFIGFW